MVHNLKRNAAATNDLKSKVVKISSGKVTEVFNSKVKSLSDMNNYRLIKLPNGLTSLLVQSFTQDDPSNDEDSKSDSRMSTSSQNTADASEIDGEEKEEFFDDFQTDNVAAVALCIRVGSFFDPTTIQGLSHFLEVCSYKYDEPM